MRVSVPNWEGSNRKATLPSDWAKLRAIVINQAGGRCQRIHKSGRRCWDKGTDVDHIQPHSEGGNDDISNLQLLCKFCHAKKSSAEGGRAFQQNMAKLRASIRREPERHPGKVDADKVVPRANRGF